MQDAFYTSYEDAFEDPNEDSNNYDLDFYSEQPAAAAAPDPAPAPTADVDAAAFLDEELEDIDIAIDGEAAQQPTPAARSAAPTASSDTLVGNLIHNITVLGKFGVRWVRNWVNENEDPYAFSDYEDDQTDDLKSQLKPLTGLKVTSGQTSAKAKAALTSDRAKKSVSFYEKHRFRILVVLALMFLFGVTLTFFLYIVFAM